MRWEPTLKATQPLQFMGTLVALQAVNPGVRQVFAGMTASPEELNLGFICLAEGFKLFLAITSAPASG